MDCLRLPGLRTQDLDKLFAQSGELLFWFTFECLLKNNFWVDASCELKTFEHRNLHILILIIEMNE